MKRGKWLAAALVFCMGLCGLFSVKSDAAAADAALTDENPQRLEMVTEMDEEGNITDADDGPRLVEDSGIETFSADDTVKIVNFRTKGNAVTEYTEAGTGISGYTNGAYGADAAYLGESNGQVKFMLSGVIGLVDASEVQVVDFSDAAVVSCYEAVNGKLIHNIVTDMTTPGYASRLGNGQAPSYLEEGQQYYSYDGHYFYTDYAVMLEDYCNDTRAHAVNPENPYYNYYQYLPLRSRSSYSGEELDSILDQRLKSTSKMKDMGTTFVKSQNTYGVNALLMAGVAANESNWGRSSISQQKNNLFGLNAIDSSPGTSANTYGSVEACIQDFSKNYMSRGYLYPEDWRYMGGFLGNKASGINVKYASDPYWGEKAANIAWTLDSLGGSEDGGSYIFGVKDTAAYSHNNVSVTQEADSGSAVLYSTGAVSSYSVLILDSSTASGYYRIQSDAALNDERTAVVNESGEYDFGSMYAYIPCEYISVTGSTIQPEGVTLEEIQIAAVPDKTEYEEGEYFDPEGVRILALWSDGTQTDVTSEVNYNRNALTADDTSITFQYTYDGVTKEAVLGIIVTEIEDGWKTEADGSSYYYQDGELVKGEFIKAETEGDYYYTDPDTGAMVVSDWAAYREADPYNNNIEGNVWYHFDEDGLMQRGWIKDETGWKIYNLDSNGRMRYSTWINADAQPEIGMPAGMYNLCPDGAVQMNGWAESVTPGIWWFCNPDTGLFERNNPGSWSGVNPEN